MYGVGESVKGLKRNKNEDNIFVYNNRFGDLPNIYIVADGMGGYSAGDLASFMSIKFFCEYIYDNKKDVLLKKEKDIYNLFKKAIMFANEKIFTNSKEDEFFKKMGTTFIAATVVDNKVFFANIGDSRLYVYNDEKIKKMSNDNSLVNELLKMGEITEKEVKDHPQKNVITRAVGTEPNVEIDLYTYNIKKEDKILICSDGLTTMLSDEEIYENLLKNKHLEPKDKIFKLIDVANKKGGFDNISIIIVE